MLPRIRVELIDSTVDSKIRFPRVLFTISDRLKDWREFWIRYFLPRYLNLVQQNFATEGELVGGWEPLNPDYAAWKAKKFPGRLIMELSRRLRRSLAPGVEGSSGLGSDQIIQVRATELVVGTRVPYARWQTRQFMVPVRVRDTNAWIREWMLRDLDQPDLGTSGMARRRD